MKTDPKLVAIIKAFGGREFSNNDWDAFSGCESEDPWIVELDVKVSEESLYVLVADGSQLIFITKDEEIPLQMI